MFGKLKEAFARFKKDASDDEVKESKKVEEKPAKAVDEPKVSIKEKILAKIKREPADTTEQSSAVPSTNVEGKKGFFQRRSESKIESALDEFEDELIQNNIAYNITERILEEIKTELLENKKKPSNEIISEKLSEILNDVLTKPKQIDLLKESNNKKPLIILFVGVNGVGKTTNMAKLAKYFQDNKKSVVFAAADCFRSGAIQQLGKHADKLKIKMIKHKYGADPAAVAFDAIEHAKAKKIDIVMIDTAGRQHSAEDLMRELVKIKKVAKPDFTIFIGDSLTGSDCTTQAEQFNEKIGIDGIIMTKTDADERGGAIISAAYCTNRPILYLGTGQKYTDLKPFNAKELIKKILG
jgi:fused signal recognition particle receptor